MNSVNRKQDSVVRFGLQSSVYPNPDIAMGSLRESQAILDLAQPKDKAPRELADSLAAHCYKLIKACK